MAEDKRNLSNEMLQHLTHYKQTLSEIRLFYDLLEELFPSGVVSDFRISEERRKARDLTSNINDLLDNQEATDSFINQVCEQIRQVNKSLVYIREDAPQSNLLSGIVQQINIDQLIIENKLIVTRLERVRSGEVGFFPTTRMDIAKTLLLKSFPAAYGALMIGEEIAKLIKGKKSASASERDKIRPEPPPKGGSSPRPAPVTMPPLEAEPKETPGASPAAPNTGVTTMTPPVSTTVPSPEKSSIMEKSAPSVEVSKALEKEKAESFMRRGTLYQPERNALGQFTGGKIAQENITATEEEDEKNRTIAEEAEKESVQEGLYKFFSKPAYDAKWTSELLEAVKGISSVGDDKDKGKKSPTTSIMGKVLDFFKGGAELAGAGLLGEAAVGAGGIAEGASAAGLVAGGAGVAGAAGTGTIGAAAGGTGAAAGGTGLAAIALPVLGVLAAGAGGALLGRFMGEHLKWGGKSLDEHVQSGIAKATGTDVQSQLKKEAAGSQRPEMKRALELQAANPKLTPAEAAKQAVAETRTGPSAHPPGVGPASVEKVPIDTTQANIQSETKESMDKLHLAVTDMHNTLKEAGKSPSKKNPSGYDANNTRNPVLSSLGAGQLDIA